MDPTTRQLLRVKIPPSGGPELMVEPELESETRRTREIVETLMGKKAEKRFDYIQANAQFVLEVDV